MSVEKILVNIQSRLIAPWRRWKELVYKEGIPIESDLSGIDEDTKINFEQMREGILKCKLGSPATSQFSIEDWKVEFDTVSSQRPKINEIIYSEDGEPVKLTIDLIPDREPFICARIYVPEIVGADLGWFAQSVDSHKPYGLKVIMMPRSRKEIARIYGLSKFVVGVESIKILGSSVSGKSLMGEVHKFLEKS